MSDDRERDRLEEVLDAFVTSEDSPSSTALSEWVRRYPRYERELTELAASWSLMLGLPPPPDAGEVEEEELVRRGMRVVENLLRRHERQAPHGAPISSLIEEARVRGMAPRQLARAVGIGEVLLRKLDRRLIAVGRMPHGAVQALASALGRALNRDIESIVSYLQQGPVFASAAYHAEQAPRLAEQEDFFDAVRKDPTMNDEQRARWLALEPPSEGR